MNYASAALRREWSIPISTEVTVANLDDHKYKWEYVQQQPLPDAIRIDATCHPDTVLQAVLKHLPLPRGANERVA